MAMAALLLMAFSATPAKAEFGLNTFDVTFTNEDGTPATQAGSHPFAMTTSIGVNYVEPEPFNWILEEELKDILAEMPPGVVGNATVLPECSLDQLLATQQPGELCPNDTVAGVGALAVGAPPVWTYSPIWNLPAPPGVAARFAVRVLTVAAIFDVGVKPGGDYNLLAKGEDLPQALQVYGSALQFWGDPADPAHDHFRGKCVPFGPGEPFFGKANEVPIKPGESACPVSELASKEALLTLPTSCTGPALTTYQADSWQNPGAWVSGGVLTHDDSVPPAPHGFTGCGKLGFNPRVEAHPTVEGTEMGTGLEFNVEFDDEGLLSPDGRAESQIKKAVVKLPEGVTINPSVGEGLGVCTPADLDRETMHSAPGEGCPNSSKLGTVQLESPLVDEGLEGSIFLAPQDDPATTAPGAENPFDSLIALHMVLRNPDLGVLVKLPLKVQPDPQTGQLVTTLDNAPQLPFSRFSFRFHEGQRAPLVTPATCRTYTTEAQLYPWSDPVNPRTVSSSFEITEGIAGGSCPPGGVPPFRPHFEAGSANNNAGSFSPFNMRLTRDDGEQNMTKFSSILPPGVLGSLAGVGKCPEGSIETARAKTGRQELASPSCPAGSQIGHTLAGAGVGAALTYVPGAIYLAGPYKGAPLSVVSITPAIAGPFDAGTVAVRLGLDLNPKTAEVEVDGAASDPIPHILKGVVLKLRDLRVYVDRPKFTLNPTSCDPSSAKARLFGSFLDVFNPADDVPVDLATRYQAANCLNLGFKPRLSLGLRGGASRGDHPGLRAVYRPRPSDANLQGLVVRLPRSAFLDQGHIRTICTRVQFAQDACPKAAQYGFVRAWTPLLDEPLAGPVYLRSSDNKLPDLVFDLHGLVDVEVATRIDSVRGGVRASVEAAPDAPISKVVLRMQGGRKGLIVNSRDLCGSTNRAKALFRGQNGRQFRARPALTPDCGAKGKGEHR